MTPGKRRGPVQDQPSSENQAATTQLNEDSLPNVPAFVVLLQTRYGMPRRKVYLDLGHASRAVQHAHDNGQEASLILCRLTPVTADLGGVTE
jgi:hypothetical protein